MDYKHVIMFGFEKIHAEVLMVTCRASQLLGGDGCKYLKPNG